MTIGNAMTLTLALSQGEWEAENACAVRFYG